MHRRQQSKVLSNYLDKYLGTKVKNSTAYYYLGIPTSAHSSPFIQIFSGIRKRDGGKERSLMLQFLRLYTIQVSILN